jgi:hypothetical protein
MEERGGAIASRRADRSAQARRRNAQTSLAILRMIAGTAASSGAMSVFMSRLHRLR